MVANNPIPCVLQWFGSKKIKLWVYLLQVLSLTDSRMWCFIWQGRALMTALCFWTCFLKGCATEIWLWWTIYYPGICGPTGLQLCSLCRPLSKGAFSFETPSIRLFTHIARVQYLNIARLWGPKCAGADPEFCGGGSRNTKYGGF